MGLKISVSEITGYLDQMNASLDDKNHGLNQIMQGMQHFIGAPELTGDAWSAAKQYAEVTHIPLLRGQIRANEEIVHDNLIFASRIAEKIENEEIDEEVLTRIIERLERQRQALLYRNSLMDDSSLFNMENGNTDNGFHSITNQIHQLREDIQSMYDLESACSDLYTHADSLLDNVERGLAALSSSNCFNRSTGVYHTAKLKLDWAKSISKNWKEHFVLPYRYAKKVQKIKDDKNLSPTEQVDKIVQVYEDYLYALAKPAFDEYWKNRDKFPTGSPERVAAEAELAKVLQSLDIDIKAVARKLGDDSIEVSGKNTLNYIQFIDMVNTAKPLDLKSRTFGDSDFSIWSRGWSDYIADNRDYLGNYLFGYYGQGSLLIDGETLKIGAGVAQILSDANKRDFKKLLDYLFGFAVNPVVGTGIWVLTGYGDNAQDGDMVQEGLNDFKKYYKNK